MAAPRGPLGSLADYAPLEAFPLAWRFAEDSERWTVLPAEDLAGIHPLTLAAGRARWTRHVSARGGHVAQLGEDAGFERRVAEHRTEGEWASPEALADAQRFLRAHVAADDDARTLFFWGTGACVETEWGVVVRHWTDFCYPSDDSNVAVLVDAGVRVFFAEGLAWVAGERAPRP